MIVLRILQREMEFLKCDQIQSADAQDQKTRMAS